MIKVTFQGYTYPFMSTRGKRLVCLIVFANGSFDCFTETEALAYKMDCGPDPGL